LTVFYVGTRFGSKSGEKKEEIWRKRPPECAPTKLPHPRKRDPHYIYIYIRREKERGKRESKERERWVGQNCGSSEKSVRERKRIWGRRGLCP